MKYFAYGSNLNPRRMKQRGVDFTSRTAALLHDHKLVFDKKALKAGAPEGAGFANLRPETEVCVEGALYEITEDGAALLDTWERAPDHYFRADIVVCVSETEVDCFTYMARKEVTATGLLPSRNYLNHILKGRDVLSSEYIRHLESLALLDG
ncbi:MAG: gamma-glutamylcyclotransferase family protein [Planctomycetota bacterium]|jgi:gamma-glutamylcyclotransferase (GGCT)/AIG2-like uncharacterized protein YtfP|nr:gamma-glutamylcyclotransferase family protein [Planctomycetota bacterium]